MLSYHPDRVKIGRGDCYRDGWIASPCSAVTLSFVLQAWATSPIVFRDGIRREDHFEKADWVALDFDEGPSLLDIETLFYEHVHVIGTTKSHRIAKGGKPPCDRFRLWLLAEHTITSAATYKATVRDLVKKLHADSACVGAAQLFWPCLTISSVRGEGRRIPVVSEERRVYTKNRSEYDGRIPYWVRDYLNYDLDRIRREALSSRRSAQAHAKGNDVSNESYAAPGRNSLVFKSAVWLARNGWGEREIVDLVMGSQLPIDQSKRVRREVEKTVRSGIVRALNSKD